ncbi:MAG: cytochrome c biogenesis protein [Leptolyngbyaceae bacterium]|nr:cytochrome c biogenesis protein [Leptolyngbyaceae bacterium]
MNSTSAPTQNDIVAHSTTADGDGLPGSTTVGAGAQADGSLAQAPQPDSQNPLKSYLKGQVVPVLADLRLAILLLLAIALFSISGTVIEQGQSLAFYQTNYPEDPALFGFLSWKVLLTLGLDHVYRTWWFLSLLVLLGASLTACTFTRQLPTLKAARRWSFYTKPQQFQKLALSAELPTTDFDPVTTYLQQQRYQIFREGDRLYARKGIVGRIGPIVVHASMLIVLAGSIWGAMTGFFAQESIPSGQIAPVQNILDAGPWAAPQLPKDWAIKVNRFWIDYDPSGRIDQFYSDLSIVDEGGNEVDQDVIYVNHPFKYRGVTMYQTDWGISAIQVRVNNSPTLQLPMAPLDTNGQGRLWGTWVPTKPDLSSGVAVVAKDLQGTVLVYGTDGQLVSILREGFSVEVDSVNLTLVQILGSTGLQIKADPGIPIVYTGFALLMIGVVMSYVSHSQIWVLRTPSQLYIGGRTNRAQVTFERELIGLLNSLPPEPETLRSHGSESTAVPPA